MGRSLAALACGMTCGRYMKKSIGAYNHKFTWGKPYKPARGVSWPPQNTQVVYHEEWRKY